MILSQGDIVACLKTESLSIAPFDARNLKHASYTFTLSEHVRVPMPRASSVDSRRPAPRLKKVEISAQGFDLSPGQFILAETYERVTLGSNIACILSSRSTCAQLGLNVLQSSTFAEPGSNNTFVLEINNSGPYSVRLYPGIKIVKGIFLAVSERSERKEEGRRVTAARSPALLEL